MGDINQLITGGHHIVLNWIEMDWNGGTPEIQGTPKKPDMLIWEMLPIVFFGDKVKFFELSQGKLDFGHLRIAKLLQPGCSI